jgi:CO/xanthine dehydrogenase FAD-binding subunit
VPVIWCRPDDLDEAVQLVAEGGTPVGGGAALLSAALPPQLGEVAVDLAGLLPSGVDDDAVGAGTTLAELAADPAVGQRWPALAAAAAAAATPQVRAVATLGGTLAARLPTGDLPAALAAHGGVVQLLDVVDPVPREMALTDYLSGPPHAAHLVLGVRLTVPGPGAHARFALRTGPAPALAVVAGVRTADGGLRLVAGAVGRDAAPIAFAAGRPPGPELLREDDRASAAYRARLVAVLADEVHARLEETP